MSRSIQLITRWIGFYLGIFAFCLNSFALEEPRLLPKGVKRLRVVGVITNNIQDRFNEDGERVPLFMNKVTAKDMAATNAALQPIVNSLNKTKAGLGDNLFSMDFDMGVAARINTYVAAFEAGISERLTLGAKVFGLNRRVSQHPKLVQKVNNTEVVKSAISELEGAERLNHALDTASAQFEGTSEEAALKNFRENTAKLLLAKGYKDQQNFSQFKLSYTELGAKYLIRKGKSSLSSAIVGVRIPTGQEPDRTNPLDAEIDGNIWGVGLELYHSYSPLSFLEFRGAVKGKYFFDSTKERAIPRIPEDTLPSVLAADGQIQDTKKETMPELFSELAAVLSTSNKAITAWGAYQYKYKGEESFSGPDAATFYYEGLNQNSSHATAAEFGLAYSTIPAYAAKQFALPMVLEATYNTSLTGTNTPETSYLRMDLSLYF